MQGFIHYNLDQPNDTPKQIHLPKALPIRQMVSQSISQQIGKSFSSGVYIKYATIAAASIFFILMSVILSHNQSNSRRAGEGKECYVSIQVQSGESLWEISSRYYSSEYKSMKRYITRIKYLNHMLDEDIPAGAYLIVPYYATTE